MAGKVVEHRPELWEFFRQCDERHCGKVDVDTWCEVLTSICGENYPWSLGGEIWQVCDEEAAASVTETAACREEEEQLRGAPGRRLAFPRVLTDKGERLVDYPRFLRRFEVGINQERWVSWKTILMRDVYEALYCRDTDLKQTLALFDPQGNGLVSVDDFMRVLDECKMESDGSKPARHVLSKSQLQSLAQGLFPAAEDGTLKDVAIHEFFGRFSVIYRQAKTLTGDDPLAEWRQALQQIGYLVIKHDRISSMSTASTSNPSSPVSRSPSVRASRIGRMTLTPAQSLQRQFISGDDSGDGLLQLDELVEYLEGLPGIETVMHKGCPLGPQDLRSMAEALDGLSGSRTGQVNLFSFMEAFMVEHAPGQDFEVAERFMGEHIASFLYRHRHAVCCGCNEADRELSGRIRATAFAEVLRGIDVSLARNRRTFSDLQIESLADSLGEEDGSFNYFELLQALTVHDAERQTSSAT